MTICADCNKPIQNGEPTYFRSGGGSGLADKFFHSQCGDPFGIKAKDAEIEMLRSALWPFAMKGLKGTTVCADDFRRAKEAMPHAPDFEKRDNDADR